MVEGQVVGRRPPVVPPPAAAVVVDELVVAAAERRRPQRRDQRDLVGGIVERGQDGQQVPDLGRREDERLALDPDGHVGALERVLQVGERRARREQQGNVVVAGWPHLPGDGVDDLPLVVFDPSGQGGDGFGFDGADLGDVLHVGRPTEGGDGRYRRGGRIPLGDQLDVLGLRALLVGVEEAGEHVVHPVEYPGHGPEVLGEIASAVEQLLLDAVVQLQVGPAEAVDRLLRVADEERPAGRDGHLPPRSLARIRVFRREQHGDLDLQGIGVLELVDQEDPEPLAERGAHARVALQHVPRQHEQIVELDTAVTTPLLGVAAHEAAQTGNQHVEGRLLLPADERDARCVRLLEQVSYLLDGTAPVRVPPHVLRELRHLAEQVEAVEVVGRAAQDVGPPGEPVDVLEELVLRDTTVHEAGSRLLERRHDRPQVDGGGRRPDPRRRGGRGTQPFVVLVQDACDPAQVVEVDAQRQRREQDRLELRVGDERIEELAPALLEAHGRLDVVDHLEPGWEPGLEGVLGENPLGEAVQRRERGVVDVVERGPAVFAFVGCEHRVGRALLEAGADAVAQLARGGLGERDRRELADLDAAARDQRHDALDERGGLPRARAGLDEQGGVVEVADGVAGGGVDGHDAPSRAASGGGSASCRKRATTGSERLRVQSSSRAGAQTRSKAQ